jgi:hypothetical protein
MLFICFWTLGIGLLLTGPATAQPRFSDVTAQATATAIFFSRSIAFGDYDNDGWPDLFLKQNGIDQFRLLHNEGDGRLGNQTFKLLPEDLPRSTQSGPTDNSGGALFGDYDNDGDLDLFVPLRGQNRLLRNDRGRFIDVGVAAGLLDSLKTDNATWLDYDRDGDLDLYTLTGANITQIF